MPDQDTGFVYIATGPRHTGEIRESIRWLRAAGNTQPVAVFADTAENSFGADRFVRIAKGAHGQLDKVRYLRDSPFRRTLFLDTDTFVMAELSSLFDLLDHYDLAAAHAARYRGFDDPGVPEAFFELNTGVLAYRMTAPMRSFLEAWHDDFAAGLAADPGNPLFYGDQPMFRRHAWRAGLALCVLPPEYNYRPDFSGFARHMVKVLHGRPLDVVGVAQRLNRDVGPRSFGAFAIRT